MGRRRFRTMLVPKAMRLIVIGASGLAVGLAITVARSWQAEDLEGPAARQAKVAQQQEAEIAARAKRAEGPEAKKGSKLLAASIPTLSGRAGNSAQGLDDMRTPLPLSCYDAQLARKTDICSDSELRTQTTIDWDFQEKVASFVRRRPVVAAAYVAVDVETGALRAMVSHEPAREAASREALSARAPAASIFKIVSAAALGREGIHGQTRVCTHGGIRKIGKEHIVDNPKKDKTCESLTVAFAKSRNSAFAKLANKNLNSAKLGTALTTFGFNGKIPFEFKLDPSTGEVPKSRLGRAKMAAGFSAVSLNPVHAALMGATIARNGTFPLPVLSSKKDETASGTRIISKSISRSLRGMMKATVEKGTGRRTLGRASIGNAAKSGTLSAHRDGKLRHYTWMVGYFPEDEPKIAYAAMVANADIWHYRAGELARSGIDSYASVQAKRKRKAKAQVKKR